MSSITRSDIVNSRHLIRKINTLIELIDNGISIKEACKLINLDEDTLRDFMSVSDRFYNSYIDTMTRKKRYIKAQTEAIEEQIAVVIDNCEDKEEVYSIIKPFYQKYMEDVTADEALLIMIHGDRRLDDLELSVRAYNCLRRKGIKYVKDLIKLDAVQLATVKNLGIKSRTEIINKVAELGFKNWPRVK